MKCLIMQHFITVCTEKEIQFLLEIYTMNHQQFSNCFQYNEPSQVYYIVLGGEPTRNQRVKYEIRLQGC